MIDSLQQTTTLIAATLCLVTGLQAAHPAIDLKVTPRTASHFELIWNDVGQGEAGFRIERRLGEQAWREIADLPSGTTRFLSVGCLAAKTYAHRIRAYSHDSVLSMSREVVARTLKSPGKRRSRTIYDTHPRQGSGSLIKIDGILYSIHHVVDGPDDKSPVHTVFVYSRDDGRTWSSEQELFREKSAHTKHPCALLLPDGRIGLAYTRYEGGAQGGQWKAHRVFRAFPKDGAGQMTATPENLANADNWSPSHKITDDSWIYQGGLHDRMRLLSDGSLITAVLASNGSKPRQIGTNIYKLAARHLDNPAGHWQRKTPNRIYVGDRSGFVESTIEEWDPKGHPGHLVSFGRTEKGRFYESRSEDFGETWSEPVPSSIRAPIAPPYLRRIPGTGTIVLIWNPYVSMKGWTNGERWILASMISNDGGRTWDNYKQIEYEGGDIWYAYPYLLFDEKKVHLMYHRWLDRRPFMLDLSYVQLPADWFSRRENEH